MQCLCIKVVFQGKKNERMCLPGYEKYETINFIIIKYYLIKNMGLFLSSLGSQTLLHFNVCLSFKLFCIITTFCWILFSRMFSSHKLWLNFTSWELLCSCQQKTSMNNSLMTSWEDVAKLLIDCQVMPINKDELIPSDSFLPIDFWEPTLEVDIPQSVLDGLEFWTMYLHVSNF